MTSGNTVAQRLPAATLNKLEWLSLEALWSTAKTPFPAQWERWHEHPKHDDPASVLGLVVGNNLIRAQVLIKAAEGSDKQLLSTAAEDIGKMAGGLIGMATHFYTPSSEWANPLSTQIGRHVNAASQAIDLAGQIENVEFDAEDYFGRMTFSLPEEGDGTNLSRQALLISHAAAVAVNSWEHFLGEYEGLELCPGATPRSAGDYIAGLRTHFEQYVPVVQEMTASR